MEVSCQHFVGACCHHLLGQSDLEQKVNYIFRLRLRSMKANWSNEEGSELNRPVECLCVKHDAEVHKSHAPGSQGICNFTGNHGGMYVIFPALISADKHKVTSISYSLF